MAKHGFESHTAQGLNSGSSNYQWDLGKDAMILIVYVNLISQQLFWVFL